MKKALVINILVCCLAFSGSAQELCGTDAEHEFLMRTNAAYRNHIINLEQQVHTVLQNHEGTGNLRSAYIIPVVVHVIHLGEAEGTGSNISDAQIQGAIGGINSRWRNLNGLGGDMEVEFCLANVDPDGNSCTGINRADGSGIPFYQSSGINNGTSSTCGGANPYSVKDLSRWPVTSYYNIWVVSSICEPAAGYASYPYGGNYDGAVIRADYFTGASATPAHELGHGFFLYHTFNGDGGDMICPDDNDCLNEGDKVCDTQPHLQSDCGTVNFCTGNGIWDNSRFNYMSYCGTRNRFSSGQRDRVYATLQDWPRSELLLNNICIGSGVGENFAAVSVSIFPNPTTNELTIENGKWKIEKVELYNSFGEKVLEEHLTSDIQHPAISLADFSPGIYFITVTDQAGNKVTKKVVKM